MFKPIFLKCNYISGVHSYLPKFDLFTGFYILVCMVTKHYSDSGSGNHPSNVW